MCVSRLRIFCTNETRAPPCKCVSPLRRVCISLSAALREMKRRRCTYLHGASEHFFFFFLARQRNLFEGTENFILPHKFLSPFLRIVCRSRRFLQKEAREREEMPPFFCARRPNRRQFDIVQFSPTHQLISPLWEWTTPCQTFPCFDLTRF